MKFYHETPGSAHICGKMHNQYFVDNKIRVTCLVTCRPPSCNFFTVDVTASVKDDSTDESFAIDNVNIAGPCPMGSYSRSGATAGSYNNASHNRCSPCPQGTYGATRGLWSVAQCKQCTPGTFASSSGSSNCTSCAKGSYQDSEGSAGCKSCANRTFADAKGLRKCKVCRVGTKYDHSLVSPTTVDPCVSCPAGTYRDNNRTEIEGDNVCKTCVLGRSSGTSASTCTDCAGGKVGREQGGT